MPQDNADFREKLRMKEMVEETSECLRLLADVLGSIAVEARELGRDEADSYLHFQRVIRKRSFDWERLAQRLPESRREIRLFAGEMRMLGRQLDIDTKWSRLDRSCDALQDRIVSLAGKILSLMELGG